MLKMHHYPWIKGFENRQLPSDTVHEARDRPEIDEVWARTQEWI
jgi:hypothetical protein